METQKTGIFAAAKPASPKTKTSKKEIAIPEIFDIVDSWSAGDLLLKDTIAQVDQLSRRTKFVKPDFHA